MAAINNLLEVLEHHRDVLKIIRFDIRRMIRDPLPMLERWRGGEIGSYKVNTPPSRWSCYISTSDLGVDFFTSGLTALGKKIDPSVIGGYIA